MQRTDVECVRACWAIAINTFTLHLPLYLLRPVLRPVTRDDVEDVSVTDVAWTNVAREPKKKTYLEVLVE